MQKQANKMVHGWLTSHLWSRDAKIRNTYKVYHKVTMVGFLSKLNLA